MLSSFLKTLYPIRPVIKGSDHCVLFAHIKFSNDRIRVNINFKPKLGKSLKDFAIVTSMEARK